MADIKWIKIATNIFNDEKLLLIETLPEGDMKSFIMSNYDSIINKINLHGNYLWTCII